MNRWTPFLGLACLPLLAFQDAEPSPRQAAPPPPYEQARPLVVSKYGIVAASNFLASQAAAKILEQGGNAVDAAIAANAVTGLVQPFVNGIGGDLFAIYYEARTGKIYGLNASGWTPKALTLDWIREKKVALNERTKKFDELSVHTITVPGCVAGWHALRERFGSKPFAEILAPAIYFAENGFALSPVSARSLAQRRYFRQPGFRETYLTLGERPQAGDVFRNPALASSLRLIAAKGRDGFYKGELAERMVAFLRAQGGAHTLEDFAEFQPEWVEPISTTYRGWTVHELPPNGQGIAALAMLNIMERFPLADYGQNSAAALHVMIEAKKLAYADMERYVGDPRFTPVPVREMLSKELAARRASQIDMRRAACRVLPSDLKESLAAKGSDTIYLSVVDREGNIVSLIQSNYGGYGTGMVAPGAGFTFHNRGAGFDLEPGRPNSLEGRKRPLHTIIPALMRKDDVVIGFGIMGGWNQSQAHAQFVSNIADFGMNVQQALEAPRFTKTTFDGCDVQIESRIPENIRTELQRRGHLVLPTPPYSSVFGFGSAVVHDLKRKVQMAGTDPRVDGAAVLEMPQFGPVR
ncbi:MAG: gamma-glutamyltransferase [Bryobacteraceae bacterium]